MMELAIAFASFLFGMAAGSMMARKKAQQRAKQRAKNMEKYNEWIKTELDHFDSEWRQRAPFNNSPGL